MQTANKTFDLTVLGNEPPPGLIWTDRPYASNNIKFQAVCSDGNDTVVAITSNKSLVSIDDGINWEEYSCPTLPNDAYQAICYGNGKFVAVGGNQISTSPDGITWTQSTHPSTGGNFRTICYGNGKFVVGANAINGVPAETKFNIMTSPDGITWTGHSYRTDGGALGINKPVASICYDGSKFAAMTGDTSSVTGSVWTSTNGINWTAGDSPFASSWNTMCYGNGTFVAVAWSGTHRLMTSTDGLNWVLQTIPNSQDWNSVCYGAGLFVAVAYGGATPRVMTSPDGITWTPRTIPTNSKQWYSLCFTGKRFVATSTDYAAGRIMTSP